MYINKQINFYIPVLLDCGYISYTGQISVFAEKYCLLPLLQLKIKCNMCTLYRAHIATVKYGAFHFQEACDQDISKA